MIFPEIVQLTFGHDFQTMISLFGITESGEEVKKITLNAHKPGSIKVDIITFGAAVQALHVPDKDGNVADVVLGFDTVAGYESNNPYFGVCVGRVCGRISGAAFRIDGKEYHVTDTGGNICLHGGKKGLSRRLYRLDKFTHDSVTLSYVSPDGEEGFPGQLEVTVTYSLTKEGNGLDIEYHAKVDAPCPVMLTNHSYFNLKGAGCGLVDDHYVQIVSKKTLALDTNLVPTGEVLPVAETVLDLRRLNCLRQHFAQMKGPHAGFDNFYILDEGNQFVAEVYEGKSQRRLRVSTDQLGVQFYTANFLDGEAGKEGKKYEAHGALCLETHGFPDAVNRSKFPSIILHPRNEYTQKTTYVFDTRA